MTVGMPALHQALFCIPASHIHLTLSEVVCVLELLNNGLILSLQPSYLTFLQPPASKSLHIYHLAPPLVSLVLSERV